MDGIVLKHDDVKGEQNKPGKKRLIDPNQLYGTEREAEKQTEVEKEEERQRAEKLETMRE